MANDDGGPPLASSYSARVALVLLALCPALILGTAGQVLQPDLIKSLHTSTTGLGVAEGLANAGYAFGAVLAVALVKRINPRRLLIAYESLFAIGSLAAAAAPTLGWFAAGRTVQGVTTGLLLVAALPPLVTAFGAAKLPVTVAVVDIGLFGATTLGPLIGGLAGGHGDAWRLIHIGAAFAGVAGATVAALAVPSSDPLDPDTPIDWSAVGLAAVATTLPFVATGLLFGSPLLSLRVGGPLVVGLVALGALVATQYRHRDPLTPVKLISHTIPLTGLAAAMFAGAVAVTAIELTLLYASDVAKLQPGHLVTLFWPATVAVVVASVVFGRLFRTRGVPGLVLTGIALLAVGSAAIGWLEPSRAGWLIPAIGIAVGFGAGASVSPGLFHAALAVPSDEIGPAFALVELLRAEAAFLVAPLLVHLAQSHGRNPGALTSGVHEAAWIGAAIGVLGVAVSVGIPVIGGARPQQPDLPAWAEEGDQAIESPPFADAVRQ